MAATEQNFEEWLSEKLKKLNTDQEVFGTYIKSILDGGESEEEKREALEGILSEVVDTNDISSVCDEIFMQWPSEKEINATLPTPKSVDAKIASIMEEQAKSVVSQRKITTEDKQLRDAILANYSEVCEGEEYEDVDDIRNKDSGATAANVALTNEPLYAKNTNVDNVIQAEREKREKSKAENEKKKAQDKVNREKQKQQQQQRKEKEKKRTQKLERKR